MHIITMLEIATLAINKNSSLIPVDERTLLKKILQNRMEEKEYPNTSYHDNQNNGIKNNAIVTIRISNYNHYKV